VNVRPLKGKLRLGPIKSMNIGVLNCYIQALYIGTPFMNSLDRNSLTNPGPWEALLEWTLFYSILSEKYFGKFLKYGES
jgi:hypothetical protein